MATNKILLYGIPTLALLGLVGWKLVSKAAADNAIKQRTSQAAKAPAPVTIATAGPAHIINRQQLVATVNSPFVVHLSAMTSSQIKYLTVREGDRVSMGEVLVKLDPTALQGQILAAQANLAAAKQRLAQAEITKTANDTGFVGQYQKDRSSVVSAEADYNEAIASDEENNAAADAAVTDAEAKVASAQQTVDGAQSSLNGVKATQSLDQLNYDRALQLYNEGFTAVQDVDNARAALNVAKAATISSQSQLNAANSALKSAQAELQASMSVDKATHDKSTSDVADHKAALLVAHDSANISHANLSQLPAYVANLDALKAAVYVAQGQLNQAEAQLQYTTLTSPIDGAITSRLMDPGSIAPVGQDILVIQELDWLYVDVQVPVEYSESVHLGDKFPFTITGLSDKYVGVAAQIDPAANSTSRQFLLRLRVENPDHLIKPGMYAQVPFTVSDVSAPVAVPIEAVAPDNNGQNVTFVVQPDSTVKSVPVTTGSQDSKMVQVLSGLEAGQKVVILTARTLKDGQKIVDASKQAPAASGRRGKS